jgi:hypothetical protein
LGLTDTKEHNELPEYDQLKVFLLQALKEYQVALGACMLMTINRLSPTDAVTVNLKVPGYTMR